MRHAHLALLWILLPTLAMGQSGSNGTRDIDYEGIRAERIVQAVAIETPITLDGKLDEAVWELATPATGFLQWQPNPGAPGSERTEVRFLYDDNNLYVGAFCFDSDPKGPIVNELKEDFQGQESDGLLLVIDALHDLRSGFVFTTNPAGAKRDFQASNDGATMNINWDGDWDVATTINEQGWIAEFVIPFKTLRFSDAERQEWGLNIVRRIRRKNEDAYWVPVPWPYRANKLSMAGTLEGLENIRQGRNFKVKPFAIGGIRQTRDADGVLGRDGDFDGGLDIKYGITSTMTLDLTYRTDFAQVEADQQQLNLTRFNLFFPEKREFFLENAGLFNFGETTQLFSASGAGGRRPNNLIPFFSRRIGLDGGESVPIVGGARVTGTMGSYELGLMTMKTESHEGNPSDTFMVGRVKKNLLGNSWIGALFTNREATGEGDNNRVYGTDARFRFLQKMEVAGYLMQSQTPGLEGDNQARQLEGGWRGETFSAGALYHQVQKNFNPEVGFLRRRDTTLYSGAASWRPTFEGASQIRNLGFGTSLDYYADGTGNIATREHTVDMGLFFQNSASITFKASESFERLSRAFTIGGLGIPLGDYQFRGYTASFTSNRSRKISGNVRLNWGDFWTGSRRSMTGRIQLRPNYHLNIDLDYTRNDITLANGEVNSSLVGMRVLYAFTSRMFFNAFIQYNTDTNQVSSNIRFNIIHHPLSDLFLVYTDTRDTLTGELLDRAFVVKFTQLFNF